MTGQVYVIGLQNSRLVKIGHSYAPEKRLWFLQVSSPFQLSLLATFDGGRDLEEALHQHYSACHIRGEWFELGDDPMEEVGTAVALGVADLPSSRRATNRPRVNGFPLASLGGFGWDVRFPSLPHWREQGVLAAYGLGDATPRYARLNDDRFLPKAPVRRI
jgi:hypothetical protein